MLPEVSLSEWLGSMRGEWHQGEHVCLIGRTGTGKTHLSLPLMDIRRYNVVFGFKKSDPSLQEFIGNGYRHIRQWHDRRYDDERLVLWNKPKQLSSEGPQRARALVALNAIFRDGGWTAFIDDTGFATGLLKLQKQAAVLLNQGRSARISVALALTQPSSVIQQIPSEVLRQVSHKIVFRYLDDDNTKAIGRITGYNWRDVHDWMRDMHVYSNGQDRWTDFLAISHDDVVMVRNEDDGMWT